MSTKKSKIVYTSLIFIPYRQTKCRDDEAHDAEINLDILVFCYRRQLEILPLVLDISISTQRMPTPRMEDHDDEAHDTESD